MFVSHILLFVGLITYGVSGEVTLKEGINQTVTFEGDKLIVDVDNSLGKTENLKLCFESSSSESYPPCPAGFARSDLLIIGNEKVQLTVSRQGQVIHSGVPVRLVGTVKFNENGAINIVVGGLPDAKTKITLPNAEIYVPTEPEEDETTKKGSHATTANLLLIIAIVVIVAFSIVIIGILVWFCIFRKPKRAQVEDRQEEMLPQQRFPHKTSKAKKPSSKNPPISKSTTTTVSRPSVNPKQQNKLPVTGSMTQTQSSLTTKSKRVNRRKSSNNEKLQH